MNGSIAAIITLGFGTFGSVGLTVTIGYGSGTAVDTVDGIPCLAAGSVFGIGIKAGSLYKLGLSDGAVVCDD